MSPDEIVNYARQNYNATNDTQFFSSSELYLHIEQAQNILARECNAIENTYETSTVANQQEYTFPALAISIKAASYDDKPLKRLDFKTFRRLYMTNPTTTGIPVAFSQFDKTLFLGPIPDAVADLDLWTFDKPDTVSSTSSLGVDSEFHIGIVHYLLWRMALKDQNFQLASEYKTAWDEERARCLAWSRKRQLAGGFNVVKEGDTDETAWWYFP